MTDEQHRDQEPENRPPVFLVPRSLFYITGAIVVGSIVLTLFVRNPYTQAVSGDYYERGTFDSSILWVAIFIGLPAMWFAYNKWIAPRLRRK